MPKVQGILTTKPRKAFIQTNTLFNYFGSNKPDKEIKTTSTTNSILNYFKSEKSTEIKIVKEETLSVIEHNIKPELNFSFEGATTSLIKSQPKSSNTTTAANTRKCPFYKRIEGTHICVDAFSYGEIDNCDAYFLSHYHYDHFIGLNKEFKNKLFCSKVTANLVIKNIKVDKKFIQVLEMDKFLDIYDDNSVQVALIDANHCPGSVMFLFKLNKLRKFVLHTGDFRASDELVNNIIFSKISIDIVYLDTTYLDSYYTFLPQSKIVALGVEVVKNELRTKPNALIVCGTYTIGKEKVFCAIAQALNIKVYVTTEKKNIIDCLEDEKLSQLITRDPNVPCVHVVQMGKLNVKDLEELVLKHQCHDQVIALKPSGWTHNSSNSNGVSVVTKSKNIIIYGLEYSEHSSFAELKNFVTTLKPKRIIPTVNCGNKEKRDKMTAYLNEWQTQQKQMQI